MTASKTESTRPYQKSDHGPWSLAWRFAEPWLALAQPVWRVAPRAGLLGQQPATPPKAVASQTKQSKRTAAAQTERARAWQTRAEPSRPRQCCPSNLVSAGSANAVQTRSPSHLSATAVRPSILLSPSSCHLHLVYASIVCETIFLDIYHSRELASRLYSFQFFPFPLPFLLPSTSSPTRPALVHSAAPPPSACLGRTTLRTAFQTLRAPAQSTPSWIVQIPLPDLLTIACTHTTTTMILQTTKAQQLSDY